MEPTHINPEGMHQNPAYTQVIRVPAGMDTVIVGGQNGVDANGVIVGPDAASQTRQALTNVIACLEAAGAQPSDVVKWTILVVGNEALVEGFAAFGDVWPSSAPPPAITAAVVEALGVPGALVELEVVAAVAPE